jgi:ribonuclease HII
MVTKEKPGGVSSGRFLKPSFTEEKKLVAQGYRLIAGIDEAGRGALAGPVAAAAVTMPCPMIKTPWRDQVRDSKQLSPAKREYLFHYIQETAISVGIGMVPPEIIDTQGIVEATRLAMKLAISQLSPPPESLLIDYLLLPEVPLSQKGVVNGDSLCFSIACASIMAKVARDHFMTQLDRVYPGYGLAEHKGYGTRKHLLYLHQLGPSPIHRHSFSPVKEITEK